MDLIKKYGKDVVYETERELKQVIDDEICYFPSKMRIHSYDMKKIILEQSKHEKNSKQYIDEHNYATYKTGSFDFAIDDMPINVNYKLYTKNIDLIENQMCCSIKYESDIFNMQLNIALRNGQPDEKMFDNVLNDAIYIFLSYNKYKKEMEDNVLEYELYKATNKVLSENTNDEIISFANALLTTFDCEQLLIIQNIQNYICTHEWNFDELTQHNELVYFYDVAFALENIDAFPEEIFHIDKETASSLLYNSFIEIKKVIVNTIIKHKNITKNNERNN